MTSMSDTANVSIRDALCDAGWHPTTALDNCIEYYEYDFEYGVSPDRVAAKGTQTYSMYYKDKEKMVVDQRGYNYVIEYLARTFLSVNETGHINDTRLHLNTIVTDIDYTGNTVRVTTTGGALYVSDYVICTFSIGVLQKANLTFCPPLPQQKAVAINKFQLAVYTNIFLKFDKKFWPFENQNILFASEKRGYFTFHINYAAFFPNDPNWYVLLITAEADLSKQVENQTENETVSQVMAVLKEMYGPDIPYPVDVVIPVWYNNPLFYGSFSYRPVNFTDEEYSDMKSSVNGRLYFAGEAMYEKDCGYVQSAYFSGEATGLCIVGVETGKEQLKQRCPGMFSCVCTSEVYYLSTSSSLSVHLSVRLSVCPSVCLSVRPSVCLSVCLSVCTREGQRSTILSLVYHASHAGNLQTKSSN